MKILCGLAVCMFSIGAVAGDFSFEQAKARANSDEATLTTDQTTELISSQMQIAKPTFASCKNSDLPDRRLPFTVVMELDGKGKVVRTWLSGLSAIAACLQRAMQGGSLFRPPSSPFYTSFEYTYRNK